MRRFVLLLHEMPDSAQRATHYDLMLASKGIGSVSAPQLSATGESIARDEKTLWTWEIARGLEAWLGSSSAEADSLVTLVANPLPLHRAAYMFYEGPVTDGRGRVLRIDMGEYDVDGDFANLSGDHEAGTPEVIRLKLFGQKLRGEFELFWQQNQWYLRRAQA